MIDIGVGIAIAGVAVAAAPVAITALRVKANSNGKVQYLTEEHHKQICELTQQNVSTKLDAIDEKIELLLKRG